MASNGSCGIRCMSAGCYLLPERWVQLSGLVCCLLLKHSGIIWNEMRYTNIKYHQYSMKSANLIHSSCQGSNVFYGDIKMPDKILFICAKHEGSETSF